MDRRQVLLGMTSLALARPAFDHLLNAQSLEIPQHLPVADSSRMSDREQARLRGPVRTVSEGSTKTEYDPEGRLISRRWLVNPDLKSSEASETRTYDASGRLLIDTVRHPDGSLQEKLYSYDDQGRLVRIVEGSGNRTLFQYDDRGRKIEIHDVSHKSNDEPEAVATGEELLFADTEGNIGLGFGGTRNASILKTIYDEHDHPTETQALDADGHVLSRILRTYDDEGRMTDVSVSVEDPTSVFSGKQTADMVAQSGVSLDEMKAQLKKVFAIVMDERRSITYDSQNHPTKIALHQGALGEISRTYSYNDHGDVVKELTTHASDPRFPSGVSFHLDESGNLVPEKSSLESQSQPRLPEPSAVHYGYQYDSYGNWTEQTVTRSEELVYTRRRELTYY